MKYLIITILSLLILLTGCKKEEVFNDSKIDNTTNQIDDSTTTQEISSLTQENDEYKDWKTYQNDEIGFKLNCPNSFLINSYNNDKTICFGLNNSVCIFSISIYGNLKKFDKNVVLQPIARESLKFDKSNIGLNNQYLSDKVIVDFSSKENGDIKSIVYYVEKNNKLYQIRHNIEENASFTNKDLEKVLKSFEIIS
ncbi:hypothetical protein KAI92_03810 [Candidatus Parcubacteria bacterium]|nr:hypothetical protein [Candidatus Parcubacteria bacterium]